LSSNTDRGLSQEEFPRLPGQAFADELDLPLEQELAMELLTYKVDKEVMVIVSKVHYISQEEGMEKELADALARSFAVLMPQKVYLEKQDKVPSRNTGWKKAVAKLCGGAPKPDQDQARILALMEQYSDQAESSESSAESSDEQQPQAKLLKLDVKLKNIHCVPVPQDHGADGGDVLAVGLLGPTLCKVPGEVPALTTSKAADPVPPTLIEADQLVICSPSESKISASLSRRVNTSARPCPGTPRACTPMTPSSPVTPTAANLPPVLHTPKATPVRVPVRASMFDDPACLPLAPKKSLCDGPVQEEAIDLRSPAKSACAKEVHQVPLQDLPEQVPLQSQDLLDQPAPVLEVPDQFHHGVEPELQVVFLPGSVHNVNFLGLSGNTHWDEKLLKNSFFLAEGTKPVCLRSAVSIPMEEVFPYIYTKMGLNMTAPILSFEGQVVDLQDAFSAYPHGATFLFHDGHVPEEYRNHKGKLWECRVCGLAFAAKRSFKKPCQRGHPHKFFFYVAPKHPASIPDSWGHIRGDIRKSNKPWACPVRHSGPLPHEALQGHHMQVHQAQHDQSSEDGDGGREGFISEMAESTRYVMTYGTSYDL
jgi:hypothetical protein